MVTRSRGDIDIQIYGDTSDVESMLLHLEYALDASSLAHMLNMRVQPFLHERARDRFTREGDDVSGKWQPLSPATESFRQAAGYGPAHPINVRTQELEMYILGGPSQSALATNTGAVLRFPGPGAPQGKMTREKVKTAQQGKAQPNTPARPVLGVNETDLRFVLVELAFHLARGGTP